MDKNSRKSVLTLQGEFWLSYLMEKKIRKGGGSWYTLKMACSKKLLNFVLMYEVRMFSECDWRLNVQKMI